MPRHEVGFAIPAISHQRLAVAGSKTEAIEWADLEKPRHRLGFNHGQMLAKALKALRDKVDRGALPLHLLPARFTLTEPQRACEAILGRVIDKGAFRRQLKGARNLVKVQGAFVRGAQRPAQLYRAAASFAF